MQRAVAVAQLGAGLGRALPTTRRTAAGDLPDLGVVPAWAVGLDGATSGPVGLAPLAIFGSAGLGVALRRHDQLSPERVQGAAG